VSFYAGFGKKGTCSWTHRLAEKLEQRERSEHLGRVNIIARADVANEGDDSRECRLLRVNNYQPSE
jgi:hypothetical protein